ncbi:MAG TPA: ABC transporter ATP-binding protein [Ruminococcaceae bacterium]|nr:ABC transporter ATP-binding protein [Oscillospiraceae bacterium]
MKKQSNLSRLLGYAGGRRILTYLSWILSAASAVIALLPFWYIWRILKEVIEVSPNYKEAVNVTHYGWMAVLFAVLSVVVYVGALMCSHLSAFRIATNLKLEMTDHIATLPLGKIEQFGSGKLRRIISETSGAAETYLAHQLPDQARAVASVVGLLALLFVFDWRLGLLSLVPVALGFVCMQGMTGKSMQQKMTEYQNALSDMSNEAVEYVRGIPVVKTFGQTVFSFKKFKATIDNYEKWTVAYTKQLRGPMTAYTLAINSVFVFLILGGYWFSKGEVTGTLLLDILFYIIITPVISLTLTKLMHMSENKMLVQDAITRIDSVLNEPSLSEAAKAQHPKDNSVEFKNITFSYDGTKNALSDISLKIGAGQTVAFVGPSGGGKTTVSRLAARFWDINKGKITVGGMDVSKIDPEALMSLYSIVFQDVTLFDNTVMENIRIGKKDATDEEVIAAAKLANVDEFVEKLPDKWDSNIGENGCELSGGERQRISIARAFLKDAPVILLDEATASLDVENETAIQTAISRLIKNKTVMIIAHRMRTVSGADKIVVLKDGVVAEQGTPAELVEKKGFFSHMVELQTESQNWSLA